MPRTIRSFLELIRFSHTLFALPFALTSATLAWSLGEFRLLQFGAILACMVLARGAAMGFNRLVDHDFDASNPRTASRHLPSGTLSRTSVWSLTLACAAGFIASTFLFLIEGNPWPIYLSVPFLLFICAYSFTKRFTVLCHFWLGVSLFLAPVSAWIAIRGIPDFPEAWTPLLLGGAVLFWVAGFDILYACQDADFDRQARLQSIPASLGIPASLLVARVCHFVMVAILLGLALVSPQLGTIFLVGVVVVALLLVYEHWLVQPNDLSRVNQAFFQVNGVVSIGMFLVVLLQVWLQR